MAITLTYLWPPMADTATGPTAQEAFGHNQVVVKVDKGLFSDVFAVINHNMQIPALDIGQQFPEVVLEPLENGFYANRIRVAASTPNILVLFLFPALGATGEIVLVRIKRPFSPAK